MSENDLENDLTNAKYRHLTKVEIGSYRDKKLDGITLALAEAHFKLCPVCERRLALISEPIVELNDEELRGVEITAADIALARRVINKTRFDESSPASKITDAADALFEKVAGYMRQVEAGLQAFFGQLRPAHRGGESGKKLWRSQSEDGTMKAWLVFEKNTDLTFHFSLKAPGLEGRRIKLKLGRFTEEIALQPSTDNELYARFAVPREKRPRDLTAISIEML